MPERRISKEDLSVPREGPRASQGSNPISWQYLAALFDTHSSLYEKKMGGGLEARLRFSSYDRNFLEELRSLLGGSITAEAHPKGPYYRLTITGYWRVQRILRLLLPFLRKKRSLVERWLLLHEAQAQLQKLQRRLRLKPGKLLRAEARSLGRMARQLLSPPLRDTK